MYLCAIGGTFIIIRIGDNKLNGNNIDNKPEIISYSEYDVYKMIEKISKIENIYVEIVLHDGATNYFYKKGDLIKQIGSGYKDKNTQTFSIYNAESNEIKTYNSTYKKGIIFSFGDTGSTYYSEVCKNIIDSKDEMEYEIEKDNIDGNECLKITFKRAQGVFAIVWFDLDNNLVIKTSDIEKNVTKFENIKLDFVTNEDFTIPSDIQFTYVDR